ncbi:hypothetical protein [Streptomyces sp. CBMA152]|uniref:hypothetical protein n=1 Tax=Streptomyces sp. CBMA152 TaxID=1896312 RepID=UPI00166160A2|nr:hypothetical protein [Streptomyces sp. CBMA152]
MTGRTRMTPRRQPLWAGLVLALWGTAFLARWLIGDWPWPLGALGAASLVTAPFLLRAALRPGT